MEPADPHTPSEPVKPRASLVGGNGNRPPTAPGVSPAADSQPAQVAPADVLPAEARRAARRRRWIAGLVMGISMLIAMLLLLYAGYWLYHQKDPPFSSSRFARPPAGAAFRARRSRAG